MSVALSPLVQELRELRIQGGMTQMTVASRAGYTATEISRWEKGQNEPRLYALMIWAEALGKRLALVEAEKRGKP